MLHCFPRTWSEFMTLQRSALALGGLLLLQNLPLELRAWGPEGHAATGILAMKLVDELARVQLDSILGSTDDTRMDEICNLAGRS
jgi:hypothetical protein